MKRTMLQALIASGPALDAAEQWDYGEAMRGSVFCFVAGALMAACLLMGCESQPAASAARSAAATPASLPPRITAKDGMMQIYIAAGAFLMGSTDTDIDAVAQASASSTDAFADERPQHTVYLDAYWIDKYEVTNAMFARFVAETGYKTDAERLGGGIDLDPARAEWHMAKDADWRHPHGPTSNIVGLDNHPVVQVTYMDARAYCLWAGRRLPTEAEWEKAARGTEGRLYPWGSQLPAGNLLNFADRNVNISMADINENDAYEYTAPVGSFPAGMSQYGVMDMAGNVSEWVADLYSATYYSHSPARNPAGPSKGPVQFRGGGWSRKARYLRATARYQYVNGNRNSSLGFRCASSVSVGFPAAGASSSRIESLAKTSMRDLAATDFDALHTAVGTSGNEFLIFGNVPVAEPAEDLPSTLAGFLGRWEGYGWFPPVTKDWKYVLSIQEITRQGGTALFWAGTNLQYPALAKQVTFQVVAGNIPSIQWQYTDKGAQTVFTFACEDGGKTLRGTQSIPSRNSALAPIVLDKGRSFTVFKDYARYLADKRIHPRWYHDSVMTSFYSQGYLLYLPEGYESRPEETWPLMIFLHGSGDRGYNLFVLAKASPFMWIREHGPLPFIIVAPLLAPSELYASFSDDYMQKVLDGALADYRVDRHRIYVTGLSLGGEATYRFALKRPDAFAAIAPLSAFLTSVPDMSPIKDLPVWDTHGANDTVIPLAVGRKPADALIRIGGNVRFTVLSDHDHDVWTDTYSNPGFYDWLLQHTRP